VDVDAQVEELADLLVDFGARVGDGACLGDFFGDGFVFFRWWCRPLLRIMRSINQSFSPLAKDSSDRGGGKKREGYLYGLC